ncbi:MAG: DNA primase [Paludibacteraceae bacterium]
MIDQQTVDRIHEAAHIEDVVGDYVTLRKRGVNMIGLCPFHDEKTPSFTVSPAKGIFKCFGCGKGGNSVHFIMEHEQLSYADALKYLARKYHIEVVEKELTPEEEAQKNDRESMLLVNEYARKYFSDTLHYHVDGMAVALSYFRERGFRDDIIQKFQLGYCLDEKDAFTQSALKSGYQKELLVKTGLTFEGENNYVADRFRGRVIFPVHSLSGKVLAFGGRILKKDDKLAKYVNSPESEVYHKSNELYGIFFSKQAIIKHDRCYLVEGYTDVISMHQSGIENVVASSGTSLTPGQIRLIHRFTENVTVIYDGDPAGIKASIRGIDLLLEEGINIKVLLLPDGDDPDSFARKNNASDFIRFVEENSVDFLRFKTNLLLEDVGNDPIKKTKLVQDIVRSIAIIPNQILRAEYVKECSSLLNVNERELYAEINKIKQKGLETSFSRPIGNRQTEAKSAVLPESAKTLPEKRKFAAEEENIINLLIKYGNRVLYTYPDESGEKELPYLVAEYILNELEQDALTLQNPVLEKIKEEYAANFSREDFNPENYFIYHADVNISQYVAELITEKYTLSKVHTKYHKNKSDLERLDELAPRFILEYKLAVVMSNRKDKMVEMKQAFEIQDTAKMNVIQQEIEQIDHVKQLLSKELDRVLNIF